MNKAINKHKTKLIIQKHKKNIFLNMGYAEYSKEIYMKQGFGAV